MSHELSHTDPFHYSVYRRIRHAVYDCRDLPSGEREVILSEARRARDAWVADPTPATSAALVVIYMRAMQTRQRGH